MAWCSERQQHHWAVSTEPIEHRGCYDNTDLHINQSLFMVRIWHMVRCCTKSENYTNKDVVCVYKAVFAIVLPTFSLFCFLWFHPLQWRGSSFWIERVMKRYITIKDGIWKYATHSVMFFSRDLNMNKTTTFQTWHLIHACKSNPRSIIDLYKEVMFYWNENEVQMQCLFCKSLGMGEKVEIENLQNWLICNIFEEF